MKKTVKVIAVTSLSITLIGCLAFIYILLRTNIIFKNQTVADAGIKDNIKLEDVSKITVTYKGDKAFAGGRLSKADFVVEVTENNGRKVEINDYKCAAFDGDYRLKEGNNEIVFSYGENTASVEVEAVNPMYLGLYAPTYEYKAANKDKSVAKVDKIEKGNLSYAEALDNVAFTGDSQIAALISYNILEQSNVEALVGASADYMDEKFRLIVAKATGKDAIVVHYGINSFSASAEERERRISQYTELLSRLKAEVPDTRIIVSGVFPVSDTIYNNKLSFAYINQYNYELLKMCINLDIEYYSNNQYISGHQELFSADGLHLTPGFYKDYWLKDLILTMGL